MVKLLVAGIIASLASAGTALAQTKVITGDKGFDRQELGGAELYDATKATVLVEQGHNNTGYGIVGSPARAMFLGGRTLGRGANLTTPWDDLYAKGNGACLRFEKSPEFTIRRFYGEYCWDGLKPATGSRNWKIEDSWLRHIRDDAIEADQSGAHDGRVQRTFFDGVHTFLSVTPGEKAPITGRPHVEVVDNLMALGCGLPDGRPCEDRDKRLKYAWSRPASSGQALKIRGCGVDLLFRGNSVMMETGPNTAEANLAFLECLNLLPGSTNNTFYWLGGCNYRGMPMTNLHGACVPAHFKLDPAVWTDASNSRSAWEAEIARWRAQVWNGAAPPPPSDPDDDVTEPEPDPTEPDPGDVVTDPDPTEPGPADGETLVAVDVRPEQCPNRVGADRDGNIPVVIAGTDSFDVRDIDPKSIRLAGIPPQHHRTRFSDRVAPFDPFVGKRGANDCAREGADGLEDLLLRFNNLSLARALRPTAKGGTVVVPLTGQLEDGTPIRGEDVIVVFN